MTCAKSTFHRGAVLAACTMMFMMAGATRAQAAESNAASAVRPAASSACDTARQQAWFARQLRMTEGDSEPLQPKEPAECGAAMRGAGEAGGGYAAAQAAGNDGRYMKDGR